MDNTMLVIFRNIKALEDLLDFSSAYLVTVALRCTIVSFVLLAVVMIMRSTIFKNTVFLKGMLWSLMLLVPFFGTLKAYYDAAIPGMKIISKPFHFSQEVAITYLWFRTAYMLIAGILIFRLLKQMGSMKKLYRAAEEKVILGEKLWIIDLPISPCTFGLFSPKILLPKSMVEEFEDEELKTVIIHEKTHIRLGHLWIFFIWELLSSFYWMNPFLKLSFPLLRADMEEICDRVTIAASGRDHLEYGELILKTAVNSMEMRKRIPAMFIGENGKKELKERCIKIREYKPFSSNFIRGMAAISLALIGSFLIILISHSYPKYEILPDIIVTDEMGNRFTGWESAESSGVVFREDGKFMVDAKALRKSLPDDFPREKYVYFYYDMFMKIPGMGGGGYCAWLEDVPEEGLVEAQEGGHELRDDICIWLIKWVL